jgi:hypothetical protein
MTSHANSISTQNGAAKTINTVRCQSVSENGWTKPTAIYLTYLVNKFHLRGHKSGCADEYSSNFTPLVGVRACEEVETGNPHLNRQQYNTREMKYGRRMDHLQVHMLHMNREKLDKMCKRSTDIYIIYMSLTYSAIADRANECWSEAVGKVEEMSLELAAIEEDLNALDPQLLPAFKTTYSTKGGEQFRPDPDLVRCKHVPLSY